MGSTDLEMKNAKKRRMSAVLLTIFLHLGLVGGFFLMGSDFGQDIKSQLTEWLGNETETPA